MRAVLANGIAEDPLESEEQLQEQMDSLPYMCRFRYEHAVELIVGRMDPIVAAYQKVAQTSNSHLLHWFQNIHVHLLTAAAGSDLNDDSCVARWELRER